VKRFSRPVSIAVNVFVWCVLAAIVLGILFAGLGAVAALHGAFSAS
jgi:hypothetical protein